ncbi:MAG: hypothetical protein WAJ97_09650 [Terriglobales bacterium]
MQKRKCSDCGGELVLAMRGNQTPTTHEGSSAVANSFTNWRCGTCGSAFTAAQLREDKRGRLKAPAHP